MEFKQWLEADMFSPEWEAQQELMRKQFAISFLKDFQEFLEDEKKALLNDKDRYLEWLRIPLADRLANSGLSLDDSENFYKEGNRPGSPIRDGMILANAYWQTNRN